MVLTNLSTETTNEPHLKTSKDSKSLIIRREDGSLKLIIKSYSHVFKYVIQFYA